MGYIPLYKDIFIRWGEVSQVLALVNIEETMRLVTGNSPTGLFRGSAEALKSMA
jgi:hypothetical protein